MMTEDKLIRSGHGSDSHGGLVINLKRRKLMVFLCYTALLYCLQFSCYVHFYY